MAEKSSVEVPIAHRKLPSALTDAHVQSLIDAAVIAERKRVVDVVQKEMAYWDKREGVGWSWEKVRSRILASVGPIDR